MQSFKLGLATFACWLVVVLAGTVLATSPPTQHGSQSPSSSTPSTPVHYSAISSVVSPAKGRYTLTAAAQSARAKRKGTLLIPGRGYVPKEEVTPAMLEGREAILKARPRRSYTMSPAALQARTRPTPNRQRASRENVKIALRASVQKQAQMRTPEQEAKHLKRKKAAEQRGARKEAKAAIQASMSHSSSQPPMHDPATNTQTTDDFMVHDTRPAAP